MFAAFLSGEIVSSTPMRQTLADWAKTATGRAAAVAASVIINRRFTRVWFAPLTRACNVSRPMNTSLPIHDKAMPVLLMTAEDVSVWLNGTLEEALKLQKPQPDDALVITPYDEKKAA